MDYSKITELDLSNKGLTKLPDLSLYTNLKKLYCSNNKLTSLPTLTENLRLLTYDYNPIYDIIDSNNVFIINKKLKIVHKFCHLYYCLKFKTQFRDLLWQKIREPKIMKNYHPSYLNKLLIDDAEGREDLDIDLVINSWI